MTGTGSTGSSDQRAPASIYEQLRAETQAGLHEAQAIFHTGPFAEADMASFGPALSELSMSLARNPARLVGPVTRYGMGLMRAGAAAALRATGQAVAGPVPERTDKRFADPAWEGNAFLWLSRQRYLLLERLAGELLEAADLDQQSGRKAAFLVRLLMEALAPTNLPWSNPAVIKRAYETGGLSLARGLRTFLTDVATNGGMPRQVVPGSFVVGRDLAVTPGRVVFRNELMELIQYAPQTDEVHEIPLLFSPPWINKYYIMDLSPGRSLVEWAVRHGHTVFMISYRNPDPAMRDVRLDDYLLSGPRAALDAVSVITRSEKVNLLGLCLGGTLTMALLAYLDATNGTRVNSATFLNTLIDFSEPGVLGVFTDEQTVARLEKQMSRTGFLPGENMRTTFDLLRAGDLIWTYVVNNWLMGSDPPPFDLLAWNADSTRMPAQMHSFYLRHCYLSNELARGEMELAGQRLDVGAVGQDIYYLAAEQDHIAPWRSSYKGALLPKGTVRFVLSNSGHIAGVVNPPNPKSKHWAAENGKLPDDPVAWRRQATEHAGTWWEDWARWAAQRGGPLRKPPRMGSRRYPAQEDAPGRYVLEK